MSDREMEKGREVRKEKGDRENFLRNQDADHFNTNDLDI